jgi:hypothetical protein
MYKSVILITIAGTLWVATGSASAQSSNAGRAPAAGAAQSAANGLFIAIPSVSALNRPIAASVVRTPDFVAAPPGLAIAASNFSATAPGRSGAAPGQSGTAPGLAGKSTDQEKSAKESGSSKDAREASLTVDARRKELHKIPTCN